MLQQLRSSLLAGRAAKTGNAVIPRSGSTAGKLRPLWPPGNQKPKSSNFSGNLGSLDLGRTDKI